MWPLRKRFSSPRLLFLLRLCDYLDGRVVHLVPSYVRVRLSLHLYREVFYFVCVVYVHIWGSRIQQGETSVRGQFYTIVHDLLYVYNIIPVLFFLDILTLIVHASPADPILPAKIWSLPEHLILSSSYACFRCYRAILSRRGRHIVSKYMYV